APSDYFVAVNLERPMNAYLYAYFALGILFGVFTFTNRHLFSEGPTRGPKDNPTIFDGRSFWVTLCMFWWPVMALTGVNTAFILAKRRRIALQAVK
ncbi:MAG: hypothetical protein ACO24G_06375, partial [Burkholderiaceae bacterium]